MCERFSNFGDGRPRRFLKEKRLVGASKEISEAFNPELSSFGRFSSTENTADVKVPHAEGGLEGPTISYSLKIGECCGST